MPGHNASESWNSSVVVRSCVINKSTLKDCVAISCGYSNGATTITVHITTDIVGAARITRRTNTAPRCYVAPSTMVTTRGIELDELIGKMDGASMQRTLMRIRMQAMVMMPTT